MEPVTVTSTPLSSCFAAFFAIIPSYSWTVLSESPLLHEALPVACSTSISSFQLSVPMAKPFLTHCLVVSQLERAHVPTIVLPGACVLGGQGETISTASELAAEGSDDMRVSYGGAKIDGEVTVELALVQERADSGRVFGPRLGGFGLRMMLWFRGVAGWYSNGRKSVFTG